MQTADCTVPALSQVLHESLSSDCKKAFLRLAGGRKTARRNPRVNTSEGLDEQGPLETAANTKESLYSHLNNEGQPEKTWRDK